MRTLYCSLFYLWPPQGGYGQRLTNFVRALTDMGEVDFLCLDGSDMVREPPPPGVNVLDAPLGPDLPTRAWMKLWANSDAPRRIVRRDPSPARAIIPDLLDGPYDQVVVSHLDAWYLTRGLLPRVTMLDLDNLENLAIASRRRRGPGVPPRSTVRHRAEAVGAWSAESLIGLVDERRWDALQRAAAEEVDMVAVCSPLDVGRSRCPNAVSIPNGYELAWETPDHHEVHEYGAPVFTFVGLMGYIPNSDAVRWFANEILPLIQRQIPNAQFRVVGQRGELVADLEEIPGVTVVGAVESLRDELAAADVAVIPIRSGAGTRLKVVEAMANRLPIVTTAMGSEGIDVTDRAQVLMAETPERFAAACVEVCRDRPLRKQLIESAFERYEDAYRWSTITDHLKEVLAASSRR